MSTKLEFLITAQDRASAALKGVGGTLKGLQDRAGALSGALAGVAPALAAAFSVTAITAFAKRTIDGLDALNDLSDATGASIENLSALEDVAARTGTSMDTVSTAVVKLNKVLADAKPGSDAAAALEAIGLSAAELKRLDPAEALQRTAMALAAFADDGNKARLTQELFGKSLREVAPLLKDLAESGKLVATVTTEQAKAAEAFNIELFQMQKNAADLARVLVGPVLSAINETIELFRQGAKEGKGFFEVLRNEQLRLLGFGEQAKDVKSLSDRLAELNDLLDTNRRLTLGIGQAPKLEAERKQVQAAIDMLRNVDYGNEGRGRPRPSLPDIGGGSAPTRAGSGRAVKPDIPYAITDPRADSKQRFLQAEKDYERTDQILRDIEESATKAAAALRTSLIAEGAAVFESTRTPLEKLNIELARQQALLDALGPAYEDTYARAVFAAQDAADAAMKLPEVLKEVSTFADEAARNIQDALGDTLAATLKGDFDDIGDMWINLLARMAAEAAAAQIAEALFGKKGSGGDSDTTGILSELLKGLFGGARAEGGPVSAGRAYLVGERGPELIVPRGAGTVIPNNKLGGGGAVNFVTNVQGDASANTLKLIRQSQAQMVAQMRYRERF